MLPVSLLVALGCLATTSATTPANDNESYNEDLSLKPLANGKVLATFKFAITKSDWDTTSSSRVWTDDETDNHYTLFPLTLAQLFRQHSVSEFHLSLNAGKWSYADWGTPDVASVGGGAELWAWMSSENQKSLQTHWQGLTNGLSGLFCASLGALDERRTTTPKYAFRPEGLLRANQSLLYASFPSENVCTENLTPFIKMLPCKTKSGIGMLLNSYRIFDADWHGISVHMTSPSPGVISLNMYVSAVLDPVRTSPHSVKDWSLSSLFNGRVSRSCPVATSSLLHVQSPLGEPYSLSPEPPRTAPGNATFDLLDVRNPLDVSMKFQDPSVQYDFSRSEDVSLLAQRHLYGGLAEGRLSMTLRNTRDSPLNTLWLETLPWFIGLYLHTLEVTVNGVRRPDLIRILVYEPAHDSSQKSTLLESIIDLPPNSVVTISLDLVKASILYTEHPPDASRGWDLPPAMLSLPSGQRIYTNTLLAELPTPDFSMPYNVIIMTSTLLALFFGSVFNALARSFVWLEK